MSPVKYLILGAGPSGLTFAHALLRHGEESFLLLEREAEAGGLCRSAQVDDAPLDFGGGHFLDVARKDVLEFLFRFMPESEWRSFARVAKVRLRGVEIGHPLERHLWELPVPDQLDFLESAARAGQARGAAKPARFGDWIRWKLGDRIAEEYMLPYNRKMWRMDLDRLGTYWLEKLPDVSFREILASCLQRDGRGVLPAHGTFLYPRQHGYGEVWRRMGQALGDHLALRAPVTEIEVETRTVNREFRAEFIVNTIPWTTWARVANLPPEVSRAVSQLVHVPIDIDYHPETIPGPAHWIYEPDERISYHRILCRASFRAGARGHWTETHSRAADPVAGIRFSNEYAYPVNTVEKPEAMAAIRKWARAAGVLPLGRWGEWEHINSDVAVERAFERARELTRSRI
jgi:protoporphyrinogen oxidase